MGKVVAIDFGLRRTGLALSDEGRTFAFGWGTVESSRLMETLQKLQVSDGFDTIVLGMPKKLNTEDTHISENVRLLKEALEKEFDPMEVVLIDERFTSKMASDAIALSGMSKMKRQGKALIDKVSATLILQSYLDSTRNVY